MLLKQALLENHRRTIGMYFMTADNNAQSSAEVKKVILSPSARLSIGGASRTAAEFTDRCRDACLKTFTKEITKPPERENWKATQRQHQKKTNGKKSHAGANKHYRY